MEMCEIYLKYESFLYLREAISFVYSFETDYVKKIGKIYGNKLYILR